MAAETNPAIAARVRVTPYRERFMACASCRGAAIAMVMVDDEPSSTACRRHVNTWVRRAVDRLSREGS